MATQLELVNRVLRRLREDEVSASNETEYSALVSQFVADAHREVSEAWNWHYTLQTVDFETEAGVAGYFLHATVANGGDVLDTSNVLTSRSMLRIRADGLPDIHIGDSSTDNYKKQIILLSDEQRHALANMASSSPGTGDAEYPTHASVRKNTNNTWTCQLWPTPSVTGKFVRMAWSIPHDDLETDGSTDDEELYTPNQPIYLRALWFALNERGEEMGEPNSVIEQAYINSLGAEKERAMTYEQTTGRFDWYRG